MPSSAAEEKSRGEAWHNSGLDDIDDCPRRFAARYVLGQPVTPKPATIAGTAYHAAMELFDRARKDGIPEGVPDENLLAEGLKALEEQASAVPAEQLEEYGGRAVLIRELEAALTNWRTFVDREWGITIHEYMLAHEPVMIETYMRAPVIPGARDLGATLDVMYRELTSQEWRLADHKTTGEKAGFRYWPRDASGHRAQMAHYATLAVASPEIPITELVPAVFLIARRATGTKRYEGARIIEFQPDLSDVAELRERVLRAEAEVVADRWLPNPATKFCAWCPFHSRCQGGDGVLHLPMPVLRERLGL